METKAKIIIGDSRQMKEVKNEEIDLIIKRRMEGIFFRTLAFWRSKANRA